ncbi:MAG TPA: GDP-mannose 4,6-dehydratase [Solirubrobacteraceae bacterium]|nr:GDP-mannose 4,6-dehydratase [Solirubrobacteraceae bacterium]
MRVLITGASGFAGAHLARLCTDAGDAVTGVSRSGGPGCLVLDLLDAPAVTELVASVRPQVVYHLAALSSVGRSWEAPAQTLAANIGGAVNLLEAVRSGAPAARVVWASSCEVYGVPERLPIRESAPLAPANPYAVSKTAGEQLVRVYAAAYGLQVVIARPFNHTGPGQRGIFIVSSLARQAAEARLAGAAALCVVTGNPDTRRDFTDVRDVVRAYRLLAGSASATGAVFNVSTGRSISAAEQVALLGELLDGIDVEHIVDPARVRAHEVMDLSGSPERIREAVGWQPEIPYRVTLRQTIEWWERELSAAPA